MPLSLPKNDYQRHAAWGKPVMDWHPNQDRVEILSVASCYRK